MSRNVGIQIPDWHAGQIVKTVGLRVTSDNSSVDPLDETGDVRHEKHLPTETHTQRQLCQSLVTHT